MGLELRPTSSWWYGRYMVNGKTTVVNLDVPIAGERPDSITGEGNPAFEKSRGRAQAKLDSILADIHRRRHSEEILQELHVVRTGTRVGSIPLTKLHEKWSKLPRRRPISSIYNSWAGTVFDRLADFMKGDVATAPDMAAVTHENALAFLDKEYERKMAHKTWNAELSLLRTAFRHLRRPAGLFENPFDGIPSKEEDPIHRAPFTPDDLKAILDAAAGDDLMRPLIVTGICTAMRRGDVCLLKWADVDMKGRYITVKTGKTGARLSIPMFPLLHDELARRPRLGIYVFPEAAALHKTRPDAFDDRFKEILARAGFFDKPSDPPPAQPNPERFSPDWLARAEARVREELRPARADRVMAALRPYASGKSLKAVARELGISNGSVSNHLAAVSRLLGEPVVRGAPPPVLPAAPHRDNMTLKRERGLHRASLRGFHSFRTTWVTLALTAGIPMDLVRKVTGHRTTEVVLQHYFQPGREQFRKVLQSKMPALLSNGAKTPQEQAVEILRAATAGTWRQDIDRAIALLEEPAA
jgi:integrase